MELTNDLIVTAAHVLSPDRFTQDARLANPHNVAILKLIQDWGELPPAPYWAYDGISRVADTLLSEITYKDRFMGYELDHAMVAALFRLTRLEQSQEDPNQLALYPDRATYDRGAAKKMRTKPGRALRRLFPFMSDPDIEHLVNLFRNTFALSKDNYVIHEGTSQDSFRHAYAHELTTTSNLDLCDRYHKHIADSCMRYEFDHLTYHPAEAYATEDFKVIWAEDKSGKIAGRCVICTKNKTAGPIYAANQVICDYLETHISGVLGCRFAENYDWVGAKMLKLECDDGFIGPYLDFIPQLLSEEEDYLVIDSQGYIEADETSGVMTCDSRPTEYCECCEDRFRPEEMAGSTEDCDDICYDCRSAHYTYCERSNEWVRDGNITVVHRIRTSTFSGRYEVCESWSDSVVEREATYIEHRSEYWCNDDVLADINGDPFIEKDYDAGFYTVSDLSQEPIPVSEAVQLPNGQTVHVSEVEEEADAAA